MLDAPAVPTPTVKGGTHELQRLSQAHLALVELALAGYTRAQIAEATGRSPEGVGLILNSPVFQQEFSRRKQQQNRSNDTATSGQIARAKQVLEDNAVKAAEFRVSTMDNPMAGPELQYKAAKDLMDDILGPRQAASQNQFNGPVVMLGAEAIATLQQALLEDGRRSNKHVLAPPVLTDQQSSVEPSTVTQADVTEGSMLSDRGEATELSTKA
jgi:hypothetical protein